MSKKILGAVVAVVALVAFVLWLRQPGLVNPITKPGKGMDAKSVEQAVRAAALLENIKFDEAIELYEKLLENYPGNSVAKKNLAIAMIGKVNEEIAYLSDPTKDPSQIRKGLNSLLDKARIRVDQAIEARKEDPACYQLDVELDLSRISLLDPLISGDDQIHLVAKLKKYVELFPGDAFMVTRLGNAIDTVQTVAPEYLNDIAGPLMQGCKAHPRNLFLHSVLVRHLAMRNDPRVFDWVDDFVALLRPFRWQIKAINPNNDFNELLSIHETRKSDLDSAFRTIGSWANIAVGTTGSKADLRLSQPNALALLDLSDIEQSLENQTSSKGSSEISMEATTLEFVPAAGVMAFDWNIDTVPELLTWKDSTLSLSKLEFDKGYQISLLATLELPGDIRGVVPVDLFEVRAGPRSRPSDASGTDVSKKSAAELAEALKANRRHDTLRDLLVYGEQGAWVVKFETPATPDALPTWSIVDSKTGLADLKEVVAILPVDWDADSDLDLVCLANGNKILLKQNRGNRTFEDVNEESIMPGDEFRALSGVVVDFDRDVDLDVVLSFQGKVGLLENILHGQFRFRELNGEWDALANATSLATGEFDGNYSWDYVAKTESEVVLLTTSTVPSKSVVPLLTSTQACGPGFIALEDWNNDGLLDVMASSKEGLVVFPNNASQLGSKVPIASTADVTSKPTILDFDHNGLQDCFVVQNGSACGVQNTWKANANFMNIRLKGVSDDNGGGRINHFCVGSIVEVFSPNGYQTRLVEDDSVHFGFRDASPYNVRIIFPNGLTQNVLDPTKNELLEEVQIPKGSCPFLYGWDGAQWSLVTDCLWNAPLGLQFERGRAIPDRRWEHLLLSGKAIQPFEGSYELRVTEELWETAYLDLIQLSYVDHPSDVEVHTNEKVGPPSIAQPGIWFAKEPIPLRSAKDKYDQDWTQALLQQDRSFAVPFHKRVCQGLVEEHWLELDFGTLDTSRPVQLYLTGWIYPTDTSINMGLDQNPDIDAPVPPSLWTVDANGQFRNAIPFTGFPGGKPKTIVIPLDGVFASEDHRIRIQHSSEIYWDRAMIAYGELKPIDQTATQLPMQSAELRYRGFSKESLGDRTQPHWYDYQQSHLEPRWPPMNGQFTRYGVVKDILMQDDDHLVVMGAGDEVRVRFELPKKDLPAGWTRDFVMHNVGWDKDADLNTLEGQSSLPLPFSKMENYPPPVKQSEEAKRIDLLHRESLTREQDMQGFWRNRNPQSL